ncbi:unnamed protein product [Phytomonas sp. EM1]|nr:unnamed protein product [Phytomonas sp. EM1]|eukprot:CCW64332.1 unnamed protein product [Phytomonas sp. isolate EM1]
MQEFSVDSDSSTDEENTSYIPQYYSYARQYAGGSLTTHAIQHSEDAVKSEDVGAKILPVWGINSHNINEKNSKDGYAEASRLQDDCEGLIEGIRRIRDRPKNISPFNAKELLPLLPPPAPCAMGKKCLVLDVDETLLHSSYVKPEHYDLHLVIQKDDSAEVNIYTTFRPYMQNFLEFIAPLFEVVIFTASTSLYCNMLFDIIDPQHKLGNLRMFREHCIQIFSTFVKDLSLLGRDLEQIVIIDNSPVSYSLQHRNAIPVSSWFGDPTDCELMRLTILLEALVEVDNVYNLLDNYNALLQLQQQKVKI